MNKRSVLILLGLVFAMASSAQSKYREYYKDQLAKGEKLLAATAQHISIKTADGQLVMKTFYPEKKALTHYVTYQDARFQIMEGPYREWFDNGQLWKEGAYKNGEMEGLWAFYSFNTGKKYEYGYFEKGKRKGDWTAVDSSGHITRTYTYEKGKLQGTCKVFNKQGEVAMLIHYENGEKISEETLIEKSETDNFIAEPLEIRPYLKMCANEDEAERQACTERQYLAAVYKHIRYPEQAREEDITGRAFLQFMVKNEGAISEIVVLRGISASIEQECLRAMTFMPEWMPGIKNGKPEKVLFNMPINFKLE